MLYFFKEIFYDNRRFIILRHHLDVLGVFIEDKTDSKTLLKFVFNTKQVREVIKNYKDYLL